MNREQPGHPHVRSVPQTTLRTEPTAVLADAANACAPAFRYASSAPPTDGIGVAVDATTIAASTARRNMSAVPYSKVRFPPNAPRRLSHCRPHVDGSSLLAVALQRIHYWCDSMKVSSIALLKYAPDHPIILDNVFDVSEVCCWSCRGALRRCCRLREAMLTAEGGV